MAHVGYALMTRPLPTAQHIQHHTPPKKGGSPVVHCGIMLVFGVRVFRATEGPRGSYIHRESYIQYAYCWFSEGGSDHTLHVHVSLSHVQQRITATVLTNIQSYKRYTVSPNALTITEACSGSIKMVFSIFFAWRG